MRRGPGPRPPSRTRCASRSARSPAASSSRRSGDADRLQRRREGIVPGGGVVVDRLRTGAGAHGFDAARGVYVDVVEAGIIDATKVVRVALENAVSVASMLLLAEATLVEVPERKPEHAESGME